MMRITAEEKETLINLINLKTTHKDAEGVESTIETFKYGLLADVTGMAVTDEKLQEYASDKENLTNVMVAHGIASAVTMGYLQNLNMDRACDGELPEFGYKGMSKMFTSAILCTLGVYPQDGRTTELIEGGLLVKLRDLTPDEYYKGDFYKQDIDLLGKILLADLEDGYNKNVLDALRSHSSVTTHLSKVVEDILSVYRFLFEDSFGIHPYAGVLQDSSGFYGVDSGSVDGRTIKEGSATLRVLAERMAGRINSMVEISSKRQFDYGEIYSSDKIVFFPYKILEYACGRESTLNITARKYTRHASSALWEKYAEDYVKPNISAIIVRGFYRALERCLGKVFVSDEYVRSVSNYDDEINGYFMDGGISERVLGYVSKLESSMTCAYLLSGYGFVAGEVTSFKVRVSVGNGFNCFQCTAEDTQDLFKNIVSVNDNEVYEEPFNITQGYTAGNGIAVSAFVYEYQYMVNPLLDKAEPLFGYTIQQMNQKRGAVSDWKKILIGESLAGKELYASPRSDIKLQNYFIHNIFAGSRAGKGVMTMNVLISAISSGKPIFYLDRKPDMASMLYHIAPEMFIVNGGLISSTFDIHGDFDEDSGRAMGYYRQAKAYLSEHKEIHDLLGGYASYNSPLGDFFYFRAFMFAMGLCFVRAAIRDKDQDTYNSVFNGDNGIIIVVDELTSYQASVTSILSNINSLMVKKGLQVPDASKADKEIERIKDEAEVYRLKMGEAKTESQRKAAEIKYKQVMSKIDDMRDPQVAYAATFFSKIISSYSNNLLSAKNAGFKDKEFNYSDIFVLGQQLDAAFYTQNSDDGRETGAISKVFFPVLSDESNYFSKYKKSADFIRSFLEGFGSQDWFFGRNDDLYKFGDKGINDRAKKVTDDDGNWEYFGTGTTSSVKTGKVNSSLPTGSILFKPYLVLNENFEEDPVNTRQGEDGTPISSDPMYQYVTQCRDRVNKTAGGKDLWSTVRVKHLTPDARMRYSPTNLEYNHLQPGIGFKGLIGETMLTQGIQCTDDMVAEMLAKSGGIANFVAEKMGYSCWQELIFDVSPRGLFSFQDMIDAVLKPELYDNLNARFKLYSDLGMMEAITGIAEDTGQEFSTGSAEDAYGDVPVDDPVNNFNGGTEGFQTQPESQPEEEEIPVDDLSYEEMMERFQNEGWDSEQDVYEDNGSFIEEDEDAFGYTDYANGEDEDVNLWEDNSGDDEQLNLKLMEIDAMVDDIYMVLCQQYSAMGFDVSIPPDEESQIKDEFRQVIIRKVGV